MLRVAALPALSVMRGVLAPGRRIILDPPGPTPPPMAVMVDALATHVRPEVAWFVHTLFSLHGPEGLRGLLDGTGFTDVVVDHHLKSLRLPPAQVFVWQYVHSTPMAETVAKIGEEPRAALEQHMIAFLRTVRLRWQVGRGGRDAHSYRRREAMHHSRNPGCAESALVGA